MVGVFLNVDGDGQRNHFGTICVWLSLSRGLIHEPFRPSGFRVVAPQLVRFLLVVDYQENPWHP